MFVAAMWVIEELAWWHVWYRGQSIFAYEAINIPRVNALFADKAIPDRFVGGLVVGGAPVDYCDPLLNYWFGDYIATHYAVIGALMVVCIAMAIALWRLWTKVVRLERLIAASQVS